MKKFKKHNMKEREKPKLRDVNEKPVVIREKPTISSKFSKEVKPKEVIKYVEKECNCKSKIEKFNSYLSEIRDLVDQVTENTTRNESKANIVRQTCDEIRKIIDEAGR